MFGRVVLICIAALAAFAAHARTPQGAARPDYVPDARCIACHPGQAALWAGSKHRQAMQQATPASVLGDFDGARFAGADEALRFFRRGKGFFARTIGADGVERDFAVTHTLGVRPLQQYLVPLPGGRLQALAVAWDTRAKRWFALYPEGGIAPGSPLHWSGRYQNWNLMCGECHTTAYRKQYDEARDAYRTTWAAGEVGCQACHGAGRAHAASAARIASGGVKGPPVPTPNRALQPAHVQVDQCAACHARRTRLQEHAEPGAPLLDNFVPDNLRADLYQADGQQLGEVFEYGSFRQSRMYAAGVACSDCHEPHGGKLRASGNALCTACHNPAPPARFPGLQAKRYDSPEHHFHTEGGAGSQCVDCHMPARNYMIVHERRDHAIRIPRPDLTRRIGTPNACAGCHADRPPEWAEAAIRARHGERSRPEHYGEVFAAARAGRADAPARLAALATDAAQPGIVRASAVELLGSFGLRTPQAALADADPVVRAAAAAAFAVHPRAERLAALPQLLADARRAVRIAAARALADVADDELPPGHRAARRRALGEYLAAQRAMADMPAAQLNLASLFAAQGDVAQAERHYRRAIAQDASVTDAHVGLATVLEGVGRGGEAERVLRDGVRSAARPGELHFALGLLVGGRGQWQEAARELEAAAALMPGDSRVSRNLAIVRERLRAGR
ncbi:cytochrome c3 family protein [Aromatoleum toluclasticum]|uniref:cytochrome c3 family protein n=1 Tax=Aromatoleum toluclasticum TaxID=92003 RepID=UPI000378AC92|nr:cytochrome c3 family protein [Aromatoleum toluclasticum]